MKPAPPEMSTCAFRFEPLTAERWSDLERLFGARGACGGCWCMSWRKSRAAFDRDKGEANRNGFHARVIAGPPPGILAYCGDEPIGWCAVAPRQEYVALARSRVLRPLDEQPVWSVSCLFVEKRYRKRGLSAELLKAAVRFVKAHGGSIVEGYPVVTEKPLPDAFVWTGLPGAFLKAGFRQEKSWSPRRPIMRCRIDDHSG